MPTTVRQVIAHKGSVVHAVAPHALASDVIAMLGEHGIGAVLVCQLDGEAERLIGIVTERQCTRELLWKKRLRADSPVQELMRTDVPSVGLKDSIRHCMRVMTEQRVRHLPVLDDGRVVGLISMGDVINALIRDQQHMIESLEQYISGSPGLRTTPH